MTPKSTFSSQPVWSQWPRGHCLFGSRLLVVLSTRPSLRAILCAAFGVFGLDFESKERAKLRTQALQQEFEQVARQSNYQQLESWARAAYDTGDARRRPWRPLSNGAVYGSRCTCCFRLFGGAMEVVRRLNFDDRPRNGLDSFGPHHDSTRRSAAGRLAGFSRRPPPAFWHEDATPSGLK